MHDLALRKRWVSPMWLLLALAPIGGAAAPITSDGTASQSPANAPWPSLSDRDIINVPAAGGLAEAGILPSSADAFGPLERSPGITGNPQLFDPREGSSGLGTVDAFRDLVNVAPTARTGSRGASGRPAPPRANDPLAGIDLGPEASEWMKDAFKGIVDSVLQIDVNDKGRASFSALGLGEFGIAVSADRTQIALTSGDDVLFTAQRVSDPGASVSQAGAYGGGGWNPDVANPAAGAGWYGQSPLKKALELVLEIATHPLSLLVYLIIAAYTLLWSILSRQPRRRARHSERRTASSRSEAAPGRSRRRRHRIRRHRHA